MSKLSDRTGKGLMKRVDGMLSTDRKDWFDFLNDEASVFPLTGWLHETTGIPPCVSVGAMFLYFVVQAFRGEEADFVAICVGTLYPMFKSVQALQTEQDPDDDRTWLAYWLCYGWFVVADTYANWIMQFIPAYYLVKLCFVIWLQLPGQWMGARLVYSYVFAPIYNWFGDDIKHWLNRTADEVHDYNRGVAKSLDKMKGEAMDKASQEYLKRAAERHQEQLETDETE